MSKCTNALNKVSIVTQMRSGTHYLQYALLSSLQCSIFQANRCGGYSEISISDLQKGLYKENNINIQENHTCDLGIFFSHYYHYNNLKLINNNPTIYIVGFPLDSFYSDGLAYSSQTFDPTPSIYRNNYTNYKFKFQSEEWDFLEPFMVQNASWLESLIEQKLDNVIRYEDFFCNFNYTFELIKKITGPFVKMPPRPKKNENRTYWSNGYDKKFDIFALKKLYNFFYKSIHCLYPEKISTIEKAISMLEKQI